MNTKKFKVILIFLSLLIPIFGIIAFKTKGVREKQYSRDEWSLFWGDEFNNDKLDLEKWDYEIGNGYNGWGNNEEEYYTKDNVSINVGKLIIEARKETIGKKNYSSGRICTKAMNGDLLFSTAYGKIEARVKLPAGSGFWPAFWMLPAEDTYGKWPASGEIDIMEARGRVLNQVQGSIHYGGVAPNNKNSYGVYTFLQDTNITDYHIYSVEWDVSKITWYVDGNEYYGESNWYSISEDGTEKYSYPAPFNRPFYVLLNLAIGGDFDNKIVPDSLDFPQKMEVDYIRVYKKTNENDNISSKNSGIDAKDEENTQKQSNISSADHYNKLLMEEHFDKDDSKWSPYKTNVSLQSFDNNNVCKIEAKPSNNPWDSMFIYNNIQMEKDATFELRFRAKSSLENQLFIVVLDDLEYSVGFQKNFLTGTEWKDYKFEFKMHKNSPLTLKYLLGAVAKDCSLYLDDVTFEEK